MTFTSQANPPVRLLATFQTHFPDADPNIIIQTSQRELWVAAAANHTREYALVAPDVGGKTRFSYQSAKRRSTVFNRPLPAWARYPAGVVITLLNSGVDIGGLSVVIAGNEPAGPRYDYSLGLAIAMLWHHLAGLPCDTATLSEIVERARRDYVE